MNYLKLFVFFFILTGCHENKTRSVDLEHDLIIIEQDYQKALDIASEENKLLFIDFFTTWCAPCKKIDSLIFQNDSLSQKLGNNFVLLRYDAEQDRVFNLSKKHHVNSYPTGLIVNQDGYIINRQYGFSGESVEELSKSIFEFTGQSINLHNNNQIMTGYSNKIDISKYPKFYIDFVNRDIKKVNDLPEFKEYWTKNEDLESEENFSVLFYFAKEAPGSMADKLLNKKGDYIKSFGEKDVNTALMFFSIGKFEDAIVNKSKEDFTEAKSFSEKAIGTKTTNQLLSFFQPQLKEAINN